MYVCDFVLLLQMPGKSSRVHASLTVPARNRCRIMAMAEDPPLASFVFSVVCETGLSERSVQSFQDLHG